MKKITKILFVLILFSINNIVSAEDTAKANQKKQIFNENAPAKISKANAEFVYKFLLAEIATQRGDLNSAGHIYLDLAQLTKNISLAERATRIAGSARNSRLAMDAANIWQ